MRVGTSGIVAYSTDRRDDAPPPSRCPRGCSTSSLLPEDEGGVREIATTGGVIDPRIDPTGRRIAFAADRSVFVVELTGDDQAPRRVAGPAADDPEEVVFGLAEFVAAEELDRDRGYWWSPDGETLLVERYDESPVQVWHIADPARPELEPSQVRYPAAGTPNAIVSLWLVDARAGVQRRACRRLAIGHAGRRRCAGVPRRRRLDRAAARSQSADTFATADGVPRGGPGNRRHVPAAQPRGRRLGGRAERRTAAFSTMARSSTRSTTATRSGSRSTALRSRRRPAGDRHQRSQFRRSRLSTSKPSRRRAAGCWPRSRATGGRPPDRPGRRRHDRCRRPARETARWCVSQQRSLDAPAGPYRVLVGGTEVGQLRSLALAPPFRPRAGLLRRRRAVHIRWPCSSRGIINVGSGNCRSCMCPYGGPHGRMVVNSADAYLPLQWFADRGFCVVVADGRGMAGRGSGLGSPCPQRLHRHDRRPGRGRGSSG